MDRPVDNSKFLRYNGGGFGTLDYYAIDDDVTDEEVYAWLVECDAWLPMVDEGNPATDLDAAFVLAMRHGIFDGNALYYRKDDESWRIGYPEYGGYMDPLVIAATPARAICLYLLRYPEIDRLVNSKRLPYAGWATRYRDTTDIE